MVGVGSRKVETERLCSERFLVACVPVASVYIRAKVWLLGSEGEESAPEASRHPG